MTAVVSGRPAGDKHRAEVFQALARIEPSRKIHQNTQAWLGIAGFSGHSEGGIAGSDRGVRVRPCGRPHTDHGRFRTPGFGSARAEKPSDQQQQRADVQQRGGLTEGWAVESIRASNRPACAATRNPVVLVLKGPQKGIRCVAFSPDGTSLVASSYDETIRLWELPAGKRSRFTALGATPMSPGLAA
jgi:WD40 repeat protein